MNSERERVALLEALGAVSVTINGEPHVADVYSHGYVKVPVLLKPGQNELLIRCGYLGRLSVRLHSAPAEVAMLNVGDATLPDLVVGEEGEFWLGVPVVNLTTQPLRGLLVATVHEGGQWRLGSRPSADRKSPERYGGFKSVFLNRPVLVYGTQGTPEENAWALAKARYDSETFWYRGNATFVVIPDTEFQPERYRDRNVVLYGNAQTNAAWKLLLADSPVQVNRGAVIIGERSLQGEGLACLLVRPRSGSSTALVGAVAGTGLAGMRLTDRLPYFTAGAGVPDCLVLSPDMLTTGVGGVLAAGFFGVDWSVARGEFLWR